MIGPERRLRAQELYFLLVAITVPTEVDVLPGLMTSQGFRDVPWAALAGGLAALAPLLLGILIVRRVPDGLLGLWRARAPRAAPWVLCAFAAILMVGTVIIRGEEVLPTRAFLLPNTPFIVLYLLTALVGLYAAADGFQTLAVIAEVVVIVSLGSLLLLVVLGAKFMLWSYLLPLRPLDPGRVLATSLAPFSFLVEVSVVAVLASLADRPDSAVRAAWLAFLTDLGVVVITAITPILILGPHDAAKRALPFTSSVQVIHYSFVIERLDILSQLIWETSSCVKSAIWSLTAASLLVGTTRGRPPLGLLSLVVGGTSLAALMTLDSIPSVIEALRLWWAALAVPGWLAILVASALLALRRPRGIQPT